MLNDVLAVCVAGAVVVVIATILGAVELLRKPVAAIAGRWSCLQAWLPQRTRSSTTTTREQPSCERSTPANSALRTPYARFVRVLDVAGAQCDSRIALLKSKAMARAHPCQTHEVWFGRRFVVDPPPHQTPSLALASAVPGQEVQRPGNGRPDIEGGDRQVWGAGGKDGGYRSSGGRSGRY